MRATTLDVMPQTPSIALDLRPYQRDALTAIDAAELCGGAARW